MNNSTRRYPRVKCLGSTTLPCRLFMPLLLTVRKSCRLMSHARSTPAPHGTSLELESQGSLAKGVGGRLRACGSKGSWDEEHPKEQLEVVAAHKAAAPIAHFGRVFGI